MKASKVAEIYDAHKEYWEHQRQELQRYKAAYECEFWDNRGANFLLHGEQMLNIQTSDAYGYIESFIASLFAKNPSVVLKKGLRNQGHHEKAQAIANDFLVRARQEIENAARMSLIYPMAFFKLVPNDDEDELYDKIYPIAVPCWDIIVDRNASRWDKSKFVGHRYYITIDEAKAKFGNKQFHGVHKEDFFHPDYQYSPDEPAQYQEYVEIVEMFDMELDELIFYSPQHGQGNNILERANFIPFRTVNNKPVVPVVPLYFNRIPDRPLDGYSSMKRIYDQLYEINVIRSFQANAVRKASRQYLVKAGALDEEDMAKLTAGIDGLFIEVDDEDLAGVMRAVPQNPTPPELEQYYQNVNADKDKGSLLAPFTRGEALKATASEIVALASYSATELGRMARERDAAIELLAFTYLSMLATFMDDGGDNIIFLDNKLQNVRPADIKGDFEIFAQDQAATPLSEQVKNQQLLANIPTLVQLGVPQRKILEQVVRQLGLPEDFLDTPPQQAQVGQPQSGIEEGPPSSPEEAIAATAPQNIKPFIPGGNQ
jgi:hypothetical protein